MPQKYTDFIPDDEKKGSVKPLKKTISADEHFIPDDETDDEFNKDEGEPAVKINKAWELANKPLLNFNAGKDDALAYELSAPPSRWRGFLTGVNKGANEVLSEFTSPINLAMLAATEGTEPVLKAGYPGVAKGLSRFGRAVSAGVGLHGAETIVDPESTIPERLMGVAEAAGGIAGAVNDPFGRANIKYQRERMNRPPDIGVEDLGSVLPKNKLLGAGPRFQAEPVEGEVVDTAAGDQFPIRRSREVPYRPTTDITSGDISPIRTEPFPYRTPQPEIPTGRLAQSYSTAYGDTPRAIEARRRFAEQASREPITDESRLLPEGVRQPSPNDLLIDEEGTLPGEMGKSDALTYEPEFKPWRGLSNLSESILGRDIMARDVEAGRDPFRGPIDWNTSSRDDELIRQLNEESRKMRNLEFVNPDEPPGERLQRWADERAAEKAQSETSVSPSPTAKFRGYQQTGYEDMPDFPLYDVEGGPSHGTTTDAAGLKKLGIEVPETPEQGFIADKADKIEGKIGPYANATHDELISAVRDGKKPSAILEDIPKKQLGIIIAKAKMAGLHITDNPVVAGEPIISKDPQIGGQLAESLTNKNHEATGKLLGYSDADIQAFKDNEIKLDALENKEPSNFFGRLADERGSVSIAKDSEGLNKGSEGESSLLERLKSERGSAPVGRGKGPEPPKTPQQPRTPVQSALKKLANSVIGSKGLREEQEAIYKKERARRFAAFSGVKETGEAGAAKRLSKLKGELPKLNIENLQLTEEERNSLFDGISQSNLSNGEKASGYQALFKLLNGGHVPQKNELHILDTVFGKGMGMSGGPGAASEFEDLSNILKSATGSPDAPNVKESSKARQVYEITRGLMSVDIPFMSSSMFRQGVGLAGTRRWFQAVSEQAQVFGSEQVYNKIMSGLENNPIHVKRVTWNPEKGRSELTSIADQIGLKSSDLKNLTKREEQIRATLTEKIPVAGRYIRASNRSYTVMLNSLRTHTAEDWLKAANLIDKNGNLTNLADARRIGNTINELTGAANLDIALPLSRFTGSDIKLRLEKSADELSLLFFSPKLLMRDARMMNPLNYMKNEKVIRMEYLKGAARRAAVWASFTGLAALIGAEVTDKITSSDFAKPRIKDTRADAGSGLLQWMVLMAREATGQSTSSTSGRTTPLGSSPVAPTRMSLLEDFLINRLHPSLRIPANMLAASRQRPFYPMSAAVENVVPMYTNDIHDILNSDPDLRQVILGLSASALSMGNQTYGRNDFGKPQWKIPYDPKFEGASFFSKEPPAGRMRRMTLRP